MAMYPKQVEEGVAPLRGQAPPPPPPATGFPMNGGGGYYQAGGATAALAVHAQAPVAAWSTGLCDCFDDCATVSSLSLGSWWPLIINPFATEICVSLI